MTTRQILRATLAVLLTAGAASAQPAVPGGVAPVSPAFSPYLNLLRGGGSPALNYFGMVRPQQALNQSLQGLASNVTANAAAVSDLSNSTSLLPATGFVAGYQNHGSFFQNQRGGGGSSGVGGGGNTIGMRANTVGGGGGGGGVGVGVGRGAVGGGAVPPRR